MSSSPILHTYPFQVNGNRSFVDFRTAIVMIAAKYSGKNIKIEESAEITEDKKLPQEVLKSCPLGKIPSLQVGSPTSKNTQIIGESHAAAYYLSDDQLKGGADDEILRAQVLQWINISEADLIPLIYNTVFPILGLTKSSGEEEEKINLEKLFDLLKKFNKHLGTGFWWLFKFLGFYIIFYISTGGCMGNNFDHLVPIIYLI